MIDNHTLLGLTSPVHLTKGVKILLTNPYPANERLKVKLESLGFKTELLPSLAFSPTLHTGTLNQSITMLPHIDFAIFVSPRAVEFGMNAVLKQWGSPPNIQYACVGPGTERALQKYGIFNTLIPIAPPYESETLLSHPQLQNVMNKKIFIFRGNGGRTLLADTLIHRQAKVSVIESYQRQLPSIDHLYLSEKEKSWSNDPPHLVIVTSSSGLENLKTLLFPRLWKTVQTLPTLVVGPRTKRVAEALGIQTTIQVKGADDHSLIHAILTITQREDEDTKS